MVSHETRLTSGRGRVILSITTALLRVSAMQRFRHKRARRVLRMSAQGIVLLLCAWIALLGGIVHRFHNHALLPHHASPCAHGALHTASMGCVCAISDNTGRAESVHASHGACASCVFLKIGWPALAPGTISLLPCPAPPLDRVRRVTRRPARPPVRYRVSARAPPAR